MGERKWKKGVPLMTARSPTRYRAECIASRGLDSVSKDGGIGEEEKSWLVMVIWDCNMRGVVENAEKKSNGTVSDDRQQTEYRTIAG